MRRVALVTGASRGIGRGIALELAREGWDVCVNYIQHQEAAESTVRDIQALGQNAVAMQADVADGEAVAKMVSQAAAELAPISLLVNNAGGEPEWRPEYHSGSAASHAHRKERLYHQYLFHLGTARRQL